MFTDTSTTSVRMLDKVLYVLISLQSVTALQHDKPQYILWNVW